MYSYDYYGMPLCHQKIIPGNTVVAADSQCYIYSEFTLLTDGVDAGSTVVAKGRWIVGQTSAARAVIADYTLVSGSWGNANARVTLRLKSVSGTFASAENIGYGANLDHLTVRTGETQRPISESYTYKGMHAKAALVVVYANTTLVNVCGETPDQTSLIGIPMFANSSVNSSMLLKDSNEIMSFKCIDYTPSSASVVQITYFF